MNRLELEARIRAEAIRTCRGPFLLPENVRAGFAEKWQLIVASADFSKALALQREVETLLKLQPVEVQDGDWDNVFRRVAGLVYGHTERCGYDFNNTICAGPFDGDVHPYTCPKCGVKGTYRAPLFS